MYLNARLHKLERDYRAVRADGGRRCRVCEDGARLASVARFADYPSWGGHGQAVSSCPACGRQPAEDVVVRGIDPARL